MVETQVKGALVESDPRVMNSLDALDTSCIAKLRRIQPVEFRKGIFSETSKTCSACIPKPKGKGDEI